MSAIGIPINNSNWTALKAKYEHDKNISLHSSFITWHDGYTTYIQPTFKGARDTAINKQHSFYLPQAQTLFDFMSDLRKQEIITSSYGHISTQINGQVYYIGVSDCSFPYLKLLSYKSEDTYFNIRPIKGTNLLEFVTSRDLYITVERKEPFRLFLSEKITNKETDRQHFLIQKNANHFSITTNIKNRSGVSSDIIKRMWAYSTIGRYKNHVRANGIDNMFGTNILTNRLFDFDELNFTFTPSGFTKDHTWVSYYKEIIDKDNDRNVKVKTENSPTNIPVHHIPDLPYNSKIDYNTKEYHINIANTKSVMTDGYEYHVTSPTIPSNPLYDLIPADPCCQTSSVRSRPIGSPPDSGVVSCIIGTFENIKQPLYANGNITTNWNAVSNGEYRYYASLQNRCVRRFTWCAKQRTATRVNYTSTPNYKWALAKYTGSILASLNTTIINRSKSKPYTFCIDDLPRRNRDLLPITPENLNVTVDPQLNLDDLLLYLYDSNPANLLVNDYHAIVATVYAFYYNIIDSQAPTTSNWQYKESQYAGYIAEWSIATQGNKSYIICR